MNSTNRLILPRQLEAWKMLVEIAAAGLGGFQDAPNGCRSKLIVPPGTVGCAYVGDGRLDAGRYNASKPALATTPVIIFTSFGQAFNPAELKAAEMEAYLVKPVKQSRLFDCVVSAIDKTSYRKSSWLSTYFSRVVGLTTSTDGIDDSEEFSCNMTDGHAVMVMQLMSVMVVNFGQARLV
ncbi:MAG: hypothetical protein JO331_06615 [Verrucomicrobia bacterium]|nr:hypothetical protein [Verrucomicrobiota bacterium]